MDSTVKWLAILFVLLMFGAYFIGLATDLKVLTNSVVSVGYLVTGRNSQGQFANYPSGATLNPSVLK